MANWLIERTVDLQRSASVELYPEALMVCGDHQAHTLRIRVMDGGKPADLTGGSVEGYFVRDDEASVRVGGELNGNTATVTTVQACYAIMGKLTAVVRLSLGGRTITLCALTFTVRDLVTDAIVDPGEVIPSIAELLSKIEAMEAGTAAAVEGASAANTAAAEANTAKTAANSAASRANTAAASAEGAASDAILAAGDADDAADAANLAAAGANTAADRVGTAIQTANTAAVGANTARDEANTAAGSANTAASGANAAKAAANTAAGNANTAASGANAAKAAANTAAGNANTAAAGANQAAAKIDNMTAEATPVEPGGAPTVAISEEDGHKHLSLGIPRGAKGDKGDKGDGYTIKGQAYATVAALQAAVPSPAVGDQYNVGAAAPYNVYRWTGSAWEDQGTIQGQSGQDGVSPTANVVKTGRTATITITDADGTTTATVTDGLDGADGADAPPTVHVGPEAPTGGETTWIDPDAPDAGMMGEDIPVGPEDARTVAAAIAQHDQTVTDITATALAALDTAARAALYAAGARLLRVVKGDTVVLLSLEADGSHRWLGCNKAVVNMLDNGDLSVNQRGSSTYTGSWIYSLDRWLISGITGQMTLEKTATGVTMSTANGEKLYFAQRIPLAMYDAAMTYTQCYMDGNGQVHIIGPYVEVNTGGGFAQFAYYVNSGTTMRWAAVYEGAYTLDTLPPYTPKGYVTERTNCEWYFKRIPKAAVTSFHGFCASATQARITIPGAGAMRVTPTLTFHQDFVSAYSYIYHGSALAIPTSVGSIGNTRDLTIMLETSGLTPNAPCVFRPNCAIDISADF